MARIHPTGGTAVTSGFRTKTRPDHDGTDYHTKTPQHPSGIGLPILAPEGGRVLASGYDKRGGNFVRVGVDDANYWIVSHLSARHVNKGDTVSAGQVVGLSGGTGNATAPHLHIGVQVGDVWVDPVKWLKGASAAPGRPSQPPSTGSRVLRQGCVGDDVRELQRVLNAWYPHVKPQLAVDGHFGPKTERRVKYLQQRAGIAIDGIVGPQTKGVLGLK